MISLPLVRLVDACGGIVRRTAQVLDVSQDMARRVLGPERPKVRAQAEEGRGVFPAAEKPRIEAPQDREAAPLQHLVAVDVRQPRSK